MIHIVEYDMLDKDTYGVNIHKKLNITQSHVCLTIKELKANGLITLDNKGLRNNIILTEKGKEIALNLSNVKNKLEKK